MSKDGTEAYAIMQDPLRNEGTPDGRSARFLRIVEFDVASGESTAQYAYQLAACKPPALYRSRPAGR